MSKKSTIKQHVQTSVAARVVYRIICSILMVAGLTGLVITYILGGDRYTAYTKRDQTAEAVVTKVNRTNDDDYDGYIACDLEYEFVINGHRYTNVHGWERTPLRANCPIGAGETITIRYQKNYPDNNSYGDNSLARSILLGYTIGMGLLSIIPLGVGFVGLVAIHKAMHPVDDSEVVIKRPRRSRKSKDAKEAAND